MNVPRLVAVSLLTGNLRILTLLNLHTAALRLHPAQARGLGLRGRHGPGRAWRG
jgi:hypothetical protein